MDEKKRKMDDLSGDSPVNMGEEREGGANIA